MTLSIQFTILVFLSSYSRAILTPNEVSKEVACYNEIKSIREDIQKFQPPFTVPALIKDLKLSKHTFQVFDEFFSKDQSLPCAGYHEPAKRAEFIALYFKGENVAQCVEGILDIKDHLHNAQIDLMKKILPPQYKPILKAFNALRMLSETKQKCQGIIGK